MVLTLAFGLSTLATAALATPPGSWHGQHGGGWGWGQGGHRPDQSTAWNLKKFTSLVAFGDSYTDDSRLSYFASHNGSAPPVGWVNPANYASASGGRPWPQYVKQYAGVNLYNYAVSGAVCSNAITPRIFSGINADFPAVEEYEVPAYIADSKYIEPDGTKFMNTPQGETVYSIWIGTNDLGVNALLTDSQVPSKNIVDYTDCVYNQLKRVYDNGGRYFVLQNVAPLNLTPLYGLPGKGGLGKDANYWPNKPDNITEVSYRMMEQVVQVNNVYKYQTPFVTRLSQEFEGVKFAIYNMHGLITDIYNNPSAYLNGTAPLNVTSSVKSCDSSGACTTSSSPDSFLWYDALHPSEQTDRIIARNFVDVVKGKSKWATYW